MRVFICACECDRKTESCERAPLLNELGYSVRWENNGSVRGSQGSGRRPKEGGAEDWRLNKSGARRVTERERIGCDGAEGGRG